MKKLLVFVNFTDASQRALEQAISIGKYCGASLTLCYISESPAEKDPEWMERLLPYKQFSDSKGVASEIILEHGSLYQTATKTANRIKPDLVLVGTRGKDGFDMGIFGSAIYKLVREIPFASLVLHANSQVVEGGYKKVMLPVSPHEGFLKKVKETCKVLAPDGVIVIFALIKPGITLEAKTRKNIEATQSYLNERGVKNEYMELSTDKRTMGYAPQTLEKMKGYGMDLISIAADVSQRNKHFGKMDKEDILLNEMGIPVLCTNTDID
jgi:nucleotide-binding universal stress UspA family protein